MRGFDVRFTNPNPMVASKAAWDNYNQLITFSWHMGQPPDTAKVDDQQDSFANAETGIESGAIYDAILTPGTNRYNNMMSKLSKQADRLQVLANNDVPILWRPYHENEANSTSGGGWFW